MTPQSRSRISIAIGRPSQTRTWTKLSWTARLRSRRQHSYPRFRSASCLLPCSYCPALRDTSSCHSRKPSFSLCWLPISFRGPSSRQWPSTCCGQTKQKKRETHPPEIRWYDCRSVLSKPLKDFVKAIADCWKFVSITDGSF